MNLKHDAQFDRYEARIEASPEQGRAKMRMIFRAAISPTRRIFMNSEWLMGQNFQNRFQYLEKFDLINIWQS